MCKANLILPTKNEIILLKLKIEIIGLLLQSELKEFEEKFRKAMIANAQLDNEKSSYAYQVDLLKDKLEELEETIAQLRRELREKNREAEQLKRTSQRLKEDYEVCKAQLTERDTLIEVINCLKSFF